MKFETEQRGACWRDRIFRLCLAGLLLAAAPAFARINVVTLPGRDTVQLTIYNSADLTMVKETWQIEVQNSKEIEVVVDIRRNFAGDWSLKTDATYEAVDANKVKFVLPLKPREKKQFTYEVTTNFGSNATR